VITLEVQKGEFKGNVMAQAQRIANGLGVPVRFLFNGEWYYAHPEVKNVPSNS
jgi:hypothetical protein